MPWQPIITDPVLKENILKKLDAFAQILSVQQPENSKPGLMDGDAGISLFYCYLDKSRNTSAYEPVINDLVSSSFNSLNNGYEYPTFCSGISGILWSIHHLSREGFLDTDDYFEELTPYLEQRMMEFASVKNIDYMHGANGLGLYLLHHSDKIDSAIIDKLLNALNENATFEHELVKWKTVVNSKTKLEGFNLSLSHGISSTIIILSLLLEKYPGQQQAKNLLRLSVNFLLSEKNRNGEYSLFPGYLTEGEFTRESRLSWCYGDLGIATALYKAGTVLDRPDLITESINIMKHAATRRDLQQNRVIDMAICHGSGGIAHMFNRFYQQTGIEEFQDAAVYWIEKTISMAIHPDGHAGYKTYKGEQGWQSDTNLLNGIAGIGLVFISAISDVEPKWDRCLLLS